MNPASSTHTHTPAHESNVQRAPAWRSHRFLAWLGRGFAAIGAFTLTFIRVLSLGRWRRTMRSEMLEYFYQVGVKAVPAIAVTAALVGIGLVMQIVYWTGIAGQAERIGEFLVLVLVRQVAPIVTALVLIGRSGSVLVDEVGHLAATGHLQVLRSMGIDPDDLITLPRSVAMSVAALVLTILFVNVALWVGFLGAQLSGVAKQPAWELVLTVFSGLTPGDQLLLIVKPLVLGYVIAYLSIRIGMRVQHTRGSVRHLLPKAFVSTLLATFVIGTLISAVM